MARTGYDGSDGGKSVLLNGKVDRSSFSTSGNLTWFARCALKPTIQYFKLLHEINTLICACLFCCFLCLASVITRIIVKHWRNLNVYPRLPKAQCLCSGHVSVTTVGKIVCLCCLTENILRFVLTGILRIRIIVQTFVLFILLFVYHWFTKEYKFASLLTVTEHNGLENKQAS